jgi:hypothetical protein
MQEIEFLAAATLDDAYRLLGDTGGRVIAGGTDVIVQMQRGGYGNRECKIIQSAPSGAPIGEVEPCAAAIERSTG